MIDNLLRPMRGLFNVRLTSYQNCFVWQDCETVYGEANKGDRKAKFFNRPFKYLTQQKRIRILVEQSSSILNVTFLSSFKTNRLHFAVLLFGYNEEKKRNKTKIVMRTSLTVTCSLANAFFLPRKAELDQSGKIIFC